VNRRHLSNWFLMKSLRHLLLPNFQYDCIHALYNILFHNHTILEFF
jgi:hypothetical protein